MYLLTLLALFLLYGIYHKLNLIYDMSYLDLLKQAKAHGVTSEKKMWASIEALSNDLAVLKADGVTTPSSALYWRIMRNQHAIMYDRHYSEKFANHDVNQIKYIDPKGEERTGPHWTRAEIIAATNGMKFHSKVNDWDKYVAFNSMYADLCAEMTDEEILKAAYLFYFNDKDWQPEEDDCTKIWDYTSAHATM